MKSKSTSPIRWVRTLVFGATTGATLYEFEVNRGYRFLWNKEIPWIMEGKVFVWPMDWLNGILSEVKATAKPGTIITSAMWGADVVHCQDGCIFNKVLHYRSIPPEFANKIMADAGIPKDEWSHLMGDVQPEFYQAVFGNAFWREYTGTMDYRKVIPLADWITYELSGQNGHDLVMLHNQGLYAPTSKLVNKFFDPTGTSEFAPVWRMFGADELLELPNKVYVVPCTHDSALARLILASTGQQWGLWTGSWYGVFRAIQSNDFIMASEKTYAAGLVFEAMPNNGMAAISNISMIGPKYKALKNANGEISYEQAAQLALNSLQRVVESNAVFSKELLQEPLETFAEKALKSANGDLSLALAIMVNTIATDSKDGLDAAALALEVQMPSNIAIVGGFAENRAIRLALECHRLSVVIPPFAGMATQAGMAAQALYLSGTAETVTEALGMLPEVALTD